MKSPLNFLPLLKLSFLTEFDCRPRVIQLHPHPHLSPLEALPPPNNDRFGL
jgi:hypothetical protein